MSVLDAPSGGTIEFLAPGGDPRRIHAQQARSFVERLRGLIGQPLPAPGTGLWIEPCAAVHTFGMCGALDLVFVSACMVVQRIDADVSPGRICFGPRSRAVLELRAGEAVRIGLRVGARLGWRCGAGASELRYRPARGDGR